MNAAQLDEQLIIRMGRGDGAAFRELYHQTSGAVYGFALSILKNRHDAEDVMHDAFIRAYTGAVSYVPMGKPMAWILTIVRNLSYNRLRSGEVCEDLSQYEHLVSADGEMSEDRIVLEKAMQILDFQERQIVILHAVIGMKHREIAELLDLPTGTILSKYSRSLKKIKTEVEKGEER